MDKKSPRDIAALAVEQFMSPTLKSQKHFDCGKISLDFNKDGSVLFSLDGNKIHAFHSTAQNIAGERIDTRSAKRKSIVKSGSENHIFITAKYESEKLILSQNFEIEKGKPYFKISVTLESKASGEVETNYLAPLDFIYPTKELNPLFLSLEQKMLLVPYDNDMWVRYESAPLKPGRTSYDVTAIFDEKKLCGMVAGALDFDTWKNAVKCSAYDARVYTAFSGVADEGTHDTLPHGTLIGKAVSSARFFCGWYNDIRNGLEEYGFSAGESAPKLKWSGNVIFGWNSYSALSASLTTEHWDTTADFFFDEMKSFCGSDGETYINLDASFGLSKKKRAKTIEKCHGRGQKVGTYASPLIVIGPLGMLPLKGSKMKRKDAVLRLASGEAFHTIDGSLPIDITIPEVENDIRLTLREVVSDGYDYLKIDFLSHGALEGKRHDPEIRTGRQALMRFYNILSEELSPEKTGREIFISLSIAPLFPCGFGHARRCCCDAFGRIEDVNYVLNALRFSWWQSGSLYRFADPDHTVLCNSVVDKRGMTNEVEAAARYNASVISGTVMLLSDNYGPYGSEEIIKASRERTKLLANNPLLNEVARFGEPFRPVSVSESCNVFFLHREGRHFLAVFNLCKEEKDITVPCKKTGMPVSGTAFSLNNGLKIKYENEIVFSFKGFESAIFEITE